MKVDQKELGTEDVSNEQCFENTSELESRVSDSFGPSYQKSQQVQEVEQEVNEAQSAEAQLVVNQKEDVNSHTHPLIPNDSVVIVSENNIRVSQLHGINLHVELHPALLRKEIRSQTYVESLSKGESESGSESSSLGINRPLNDQLQSTILASTRLGVDFNDNHVKAMAKLVEKEENDYKLLLRNNRF